MSEDNGPWWMDEFHMKMIALEQVLDKWRKLAYDFQSCSACSECTERYKQAVAYEQV